MDRFKKFLGPKYFVTTKFSDVGAAKIFMRKLQDLERNIQHSSSKKPHDCKSYIKENEVEIRKLISKHAKGLAKSQSQSGADVTQREEDNALSKMIEVLRRIID